MQPIGFFVVDVMHREPDAVQIDGGHKVLEQRHDLGHLRGVGRHLGQFHRGFDLRRRGEIERQRDVLRNIVLRARHAVLGNVKADLVALGAGVFALRQRLVDLVAHMFAHRRAFVEALVITAGIQRRRHHEDRLQADQRDGGAGGIDQRRRLFLRLASFRMMSFACLARSCWKIEHRRKRSENPARRQQSAAEAARMEKF